MNAKMLRVFLHVALGICLLILCASTAPVSKTTDPKKKIRRADTENKAVSRLAQYGYLKGNPGKMSDVKPSELRTSLSRLQQFAGVPITGRLDEATLRVLDADRCGMKDFETSRGFPDDGNPFARYNHQGTKWKKLDLTYKILNYTSDLTPAEQRRIFKFAFDLWENASALTFVDVTRSPIPDSNVDILISFSRGDHKDGYAFDGPGGTLAHAFYPLSNKGLAGDAHFDDAESYTTGSNNGINLDWVAVHEFGHSIGLEHSGVRGSIMYPWYQGFKENIQLTIDDIQGIRTLYGSRPTTKPTTPKQTTTEAAPAPSTGVTPVGTEPQPTADKCKVQSFDTFFIGADGKTYAVAGEYYWIIRKPEAGVKSGPHFLRSTFPGIQTPVDAAFSRNGYTLFFKGTKFWKYRHSGGRYMAEKTASPMSDYGLGNELHNMDAAFVYRNQRIYFFKGQQYWKYDEEEGETYSGYPRNIGRGWRLLTGPIDAAVTWQDRKRSYFFKGEKYLRIHRYRHKVDRGYPAVTAQRWMKCGSGRDADDNAEP